MAAAPELLKALELFMQEYRLLINYEEHGLYVCDYCGSEWYPENKEEKHTPECPMILGRAAIAKAKGQTNDTH